VRERLEKHYIQEKLLTHSIGIGHDPVDVCFDCSLANSRVCLGRCRCAQADNKEVMAAQSFDDRILVGVIY
jgi:hypothetical protein